MHEREQLCVKDTEPTGVQVLSSICRIHTADLYNFSIEHAVGGRAISISGGFGML